MTIPSQNQLLASLHLTVLSLHQYFDALATFQADIIALHIWTRKTSVTEASIVIVAGVLRLYGSRAGLSTYLQTHDD